MYACTANEPQRAGADSEMKSHLLKGSVALVAAVSIAASTSPGTATQVKALVAASARIERLTATTAAVLATVQADNASFVYKIPTKCLGSRTCVYGDTSSSRTVVLYGDSHARMWLPAVIPFARAHKLRILLVGADGCPVVTLPLPRVEFPGCAGVGPAALATIKGVRPFAVLVSNKTYAAAFTPAQWRAGMEATLKAIGGNVAIIGDVQQLNLQPAPCLATNPTAAQKCSVANPNLKSPGLESAERAAARAEKAKYVDPTPWLCAKKCSVVIGNFIVYWNSGHVTVAYASYLSRVMSAALRPLLAKK
jgi:hypothetical protein